MVSCAQVRFDPDLAPCFMWTQTDFVVYVAVHIPTGVVWMIVALSA